MSGRVHVRTPSALLLAAALAASACASPGVQKLTLFVTRDQRLVLSSHHRPAGEVIVTLENDDGRRHAAALARLDDATDGAGLPVTGGVVPVGTRSAQRYTGTG